MWNYKRQKRVLAWTMAFLCILTVISALIMEKVGPGVRNQAWVHAHIILLQEQTANLSWIEKSVIIIVLGVSAGFGLPAFPFIVLLVPAIGPLKTAVGFILMEMIIFASIKIFGESHLQKDIEEDSGIWERVAEKAPASGEMAFLSRFHLRLPQRFVDGFLLSPAWKERSEGWVLTGTLAGQVVRIGLQVVWAWAAWNVWRGFQPFPEADALLLGLSTIALVCLFAWGYVPELVFGGPALEGLIRYLNNLPEPPPIVEPSVSPESFEVAEPADPSQLSESKTG